MKIAHVRERHAPAGAPWRLAAALDPGGAGAWLDLEVARRRAVAARPALAHDAVALSAADHDARRPSGARAPGRGVARVGRAASRRARRGRRRGPRRGDLDFGPPILRPPSLRDFYAFEGHVRTMWERRGGEVPEAWYRLPIFYFSNVSEIRGPDDPSGRPAARRSSTTSWRWRPWSTRRRSTCRPSGPRRRSAATRSSTTGRRATSSATRPPSGSGRPRARTSPARSDRGWSRPTSWPTPAPAPATTWP